MYVVGLTKCAYGVCVDSKIPPVFPKARGLGFQALGLRPEFESHSAGDCW